MTGCAHPGCHGDPGRGRLLCLAHWLKLPDEMKAKVRAHLSRHEWASALIVLQDHYDAEKAGTTWAQSHM